MYDFRQMALDIQQDFIDWSHYFHENPEVSFEEFNTTKKIAGILKEIGYEDVTIGIPLYPELGVIANLNPGKEGKCIALRADIDALPILENTNLTYKSKYEGVMHACGHDAHISMMLGAAKILFQIRSQIDGNVKFIFQPGEEAYKAEITPKTGARLIVEDSDIMKDVDAVFGIHVWGTLPTGVLCYKPGPFMATNMIVNLTVEGKGGHGGMPHTCIDPVVIICQIINAWQMILSREVNPLDTAVLTVGKIESEGAWNIIPQNASLVAGVRTLTDELMETIKNRMREMAESIGKGMRANIEFSAMKSVPPVINDIKFTQKAVAAIEKTLGAESVMETLPVMPSEDFSLYQKVSPGALLFLGIGDDKKETNYAQHHPKFKIDDDALFKGVAAASAVAFDFINNK